MGNGLVRMVVLDIDGTLLRPDRTISARVHEAVRRAADLVPVVLATARPPRSVRSIAESLGLTTPQVNYNGALTWDPVARAPIDHVPLQPVICENLMLRTRSMLVDSVISIEHLDRWYTDRLDGRFTTETARLFAPDHIEPLDRLVKIGATKLMFHADPADIDSLRAALEPDFSDGVTFIRTDPDLLQMMNRTTSKWTGVLGLATRLGIPADDILVIGDNENDIEMISGAGTGVAVENGCSAAKAAAAWVAPSNADDGVAEAIDRYLLRLTRG